jgi:hypothetical protein
MGEIVNLRRARKAKQRSTDEAAAAANRVAFGVAKSESRRARAETDLAARRLEAHRLDEPSKGE